MTFMRVRFMSCMEVGLFDFYAALEKVFRVPSMRALRDRNLCDEEFARSKFRFVPVLEFENERVKTITTYRSQRIIRLEWGMHKNKRKGAVVKKISIDFGEHGSALAAGEIIGRLVEANARSYLRVETTAGLTQVFVACDWPYLGTRQLPLAVDPRLMKSFHQRRWRRAHPQFAELWAEEEPSESGEHP